MLSSDLPTEFVEWCEAMEQAIRRLRNLTHGPGPGLEYQHEVLVTARQYRASRDREIDFYLRRES